MNRERGLAGVNSYERELRFSPLEFLRERRSSECVVRWLDMCCGTGRALIEAARSLSAEGRGEEFELIGVDLIPMFDTASVGGVRFAAASILEFTPDVRCDLITCVHGLHYVGDKLRAIARAVSWLAPDGLFKAHLDASNVRRDDGSSMSRTLGKWLLNAAIEYNPSTHLLVCRGPRELPVPFEFVGADDAAGPNFTRQPAVDSYYRIARKPG